MIALLKSNKHLTSVTLKEIDLELEVECKYLFDTWLSEIPANYLSFIRLATKRERVREHLSKIYGRKPKESDVDIVVGRLTRLAEIVSQPRSKIEKRLEQQQYKIDHWKEFGCCAVCGYLFSHVSDATVDHVMPFVLGGQDEAANWQLLCDLCNKQKNNFFSCCDLARLTPIEVASFFSMPLSDQLDLLTQQKFALRYQSFERNRRQCHYCGKGPANKKKLFLFVLSEDRFVNADNLGVSCESCSKTKGHKIRLP